MKASVPLWLSVVASKLTASGVSPSVVSSGSPFSSDSAVSSVSLKTSVGLNPAAALPAKSLVRAVAASEGGV